jgi:uncharacterized repeat protein (TIGR01451 family)
MRFSKISRVRARGWIGAALLVTALCGLALAGAASTGHAAASPGIVPTLTLLNNDVDKFVPSTGGNIGYEVTFTNDGTSVANHLSVTETIGATGSIAYVNPAVSSTGPNATPNSLGPSPTPMTCTTAPSSASTLTCTLDKLQPGAYVDVIVLFRTTGQIGDNLHNTGVLGFDSQLNGVSNHKTVSFDDASLDRTIAGPTGSNELSIAQSIFLITDSLAANGGGQSSSLSMNGFSHGFPYVGGQLKNVTASALPCQHCPAFATDMSIPLAATLNSNSPFYDTSTTTPFTWSVTLNAIPNGYKFTGVYHDGVFIPPCTSTTPNTTTPICTTLITKTKTSITVTGLSLINGRYQFG